MVFLLMGICVMVVTEEQADERKMKKQAILMNMSE